MLNRLWVLVLFVLALSASVTGIASPEGRWQLPAPVESRVLNEAINYRVMLPASYSVNSSELYPLLLLLDGSRYGDVVAGNATFLARVGEIPEHLIVAIDSNDRMRDFTPTDSPDWEGDGEASKFLDFLRQELLPIIETEFRVSERRIIWGHSLGGLFAFYTLYAAPDLFDARLVDDGTLDWDSNVIERSISDFLDRQTPAGQFLYFNSSYLLPTDDMDLRWFDGLAKVLKVKAPPNLRWTYDPMPSETHASIPLVGSIRGLRALYDGYLAPEPVMFAGLDAVLKHYEAIRGRVGAPEKVPEEALNKLGYLMLGRETPEAIRTFELATRLYPRSANAWDSLSDAYLEAGRIKDALYATDRSIELAQSTKSNNLEYLKNKRAEILGRM